MATETEVKRIIQYLLARYPGKFQVVTVGEFTTVETWMDSLADTPGDALLMAARQYASEAHEWPPDAGQLRERARALTRPALPAWSDAWDEVLTAIQRIGGYGAPTFSHPLIAQAVQGMGGWKVMCQMEISETATQRAQFRDVFNAYAGRVMQTANLLPDVRELAIQNGALPAPVEPTPPALPAPSEPSRPAIEPTQPIRFAEYVQKWRTEGRMAREAEGRRKAEAGQHAAV